MKRFFIAVFLIIVGMVTAEAQNTAKAKEILNKVSQKYKSYSNIKADFKFTLEIQAEKFKEEQKGIFYLQKEKFKLDMGEQTVTCDGKTIWTYLKDANEVQINKYDPKAMDISPTEIFTMYEKGFLYALTGEENGQHIIELTPVDKKQNYFKVKLYVDKSKNNITKSRIYEKNGNIYTYDIMNFTPNVQLASNFFTFDKSKHPKVIVTDLTR